MSRFAVTAVFVLLSVATSVTALQAAEDALTQPTVRAWAVAGYSLLKLAVVLAFSVFVFTRAPSRRPSRDPVAFVACGAAVIAVVALRAPSESSSTTLVLAGDLLSFVSCVWLVTAVLALGRCFGVLPEVRGLVTRGPYRFVRHPVYLGELGAAAGLVLAAPTAWNLGVAAAFAAAQAVRMHLEERALTEEFPEYAAYAARTPRLVPRLLAARGAVAALPLAVAMLMLLGPSARAATQTITPGGSPVTVMISTANTDGTVTFAGVAGQRVSLSVTAVTMGTSRCCSTRVSIRKPDGTALVAPTYIGTSGGFLDTRTLPVAGTYSIFVDPQGTATGSLTLTLHAVPPDLTASISAGGPPVSITTTTPGQNARVTFSGTAGDRVSLTVGPSCCTTAVSILNPNGSTLATPFYIATAGGFVDARTLPATGTYTIVVDPQAAATGSVPLTLHAVPPDVTTSIAPGGPPVSFTTTTPGQNAQLRFAGTAGQRVSMVLQTTCCATRVSVLSPSGATLVAPVSLAASGGFVDTTTLPGTGTYTILVDPQAAVTGTMTATLYDVPRDVTGTIAPDGVEVTVTTTTPGQNVRLTFAGIAGQRVALEAAPVCCTTRISILRPDGTTLLAPVVIGSRGGFVEPTILPATGTYTIVVDPQGAGVGSLTLALYEVPLDLTATIATDAVPVAVTTTSPGQNVRLTFGGVVGQRISLKLTTGCCATRTTILSPNGATLVPATPLSSGGGFVDTRTLPASGTYTILVDVQGAASGPITFVLYDVPPDVTGTTAIDGGPVTVVTTTPGQNGRITFAGTSGDGVSIRVGPFNCCAIRFSVIRPDGATLLGPAGFNPDGGTTNTRLPQTGTYTILVDPQGGATGDVTIRLALDNTPPALPLLTLTETSADGHVVGTSFYYRPAGAGGSFTVTGTTSDGGSGLAKMRFPGLAGGLAPTVLVDDLLAPYTRSYTWTTGATYSSSANTVTAYDKVGNTTSATFGVAPDAGAPTTTDNTAALSFAWKNVTQTVVLTPSDALSGTAVTYYTSDGSSPTTASPQGTAVTIAPEGIYTVKYFSVDNVGNVEPVRTAGTEIRIDKTRPGTATLDPLPGVVRDGQVLTGSGSDALSGIASIAYYYCAGASCSPSSLAGSSSASPSYSFTWGSQPPDGVYQVVARVSDAAGNTLDSAKRTVTIDNTAPNTTITSGPASPTNATAATFSFAATEAGSTSECRLDSGAWTSCISPTTYTGLAEGTHTFEVRATDPVGNTDPTPAARTWSVDLTAPNTTITATPSDPSGSTASFSFSSSESGSSFRCRLDAGAWGSCTSPRVTPGLTSGPHTFEVQATDAAGNTDPTPAGQTWIVDATAPETTITSSPADPDGSSVASYSFSSNESGSSFQCRLDAGAWAACSSSMTYAGLADGTHTFEVRAIDPVGNVDPSPAARSWRVDTSAPGTSIVSGPASPTNATSATFSFSASEPGSTFECSLDGVPFSPCTSPRSYTNLSAQAHAFSVRATDPAGNTDSTPVTWTWTIDLAAPQTTVLTAPADPTRATSADLTFSADEPGATFECSLDGGSFAACSSPWGYAGLAEGGHSFAVRAIDAAGNVDPTPAAFAWTVDTSPPDTTVDSGPPDPSGSTAASFTFSSTQASSSFECAIDGGPFSACANPQSYTGLAGGTHVFAVRAIDTAGNADPTPASRSWTIDLGPPETTIASAPADPTSATGAVLSFSSNEAGATFECSLDGTSFAACSSPKAYSGLLEGGHTFSVRARDLAGNVDPTPASHAWTVDTTGPAAPILASPADGTVTESDAVTVSGTAEPGATVEVFDGGLSKGSAAVDAAGAWSKTLTGVTDGTHTYTAKATDAAGNTSAASSTRTITVDTAAPETIMGTSPIGSTSATSAALTFSANEPDATFECSLDGVPFTACLSPHVYHGLSEGSHSFEVRATDPAGNVDATPESRTWTVDTTAPAAPVLESPAAGTVTSSTIVTVAGTAEPGSVIEIFDNSVSKGVTTANGSGAWSKTLSPVAEGSHAYTAKATDAAGNDSEPSSPRTIAVDTTAPMTTITSGPADPTNETTAGFTFSADEPAATFECSLDGAAFAPCSSPHTYTALAPGGHLFEVRAVDPAGNADQMPAAYAWTVV